MKGLCSTRRASKLPTFTALWTTTYCNLLATHHTCHPRTCKCWYKFQDSNFHLRFSFSTHNQHHLTRKELLVARALLNNAKLSMSEDPQCNHGNHEISWFVLPCHRGGMWSEVEVTGAHSSTWYPGIFCTNQVHLLWRNILYNATTKNVRFDCSPTHSTLQNVG